LEQGIIRRRTEIIDLQKNQTQLTSSQDEVASTTTSNLLNSLNALRSSLDRWKQTYLLTAPIGGVVSQNRFFSEQQFVKVGDQVMTVVPLQGNRDKIIGRVEVPVAKAGKVKERQNAVIKLDNYPYTDYGTVEGVVVSKSLVPKDGRYSVIITLPKGLLTSRSQHLEFEQQMQGGVEIITDSKGLLQRIVDQLFVD
ncbi:MAG TPA: HlyD family secretion protein, partial [Saprospiraceae bacterium]|nr:HlyD family secretion protein [Saprospiraceae bacterium]